MNEPLDCSSDRECLPIEGCHLIALQMQDSSVKLDSGAAYMVTHSETVESYLHEAFKGKQSQECILPIFKKIDFTSFKICKRIKRVNGENSHPHIKNHLNHHI